MMRLLTILAFCFPALLFNGFARADERRPELTPQQKVVIVWAAANALTALVVGVPVYIGATLAGKREALCEVMHGKYDLNAPDQCAGGDWVRVIPYLTEK